MAHLIVGHTAEQCTRLWVRGDRKHLSAKVSLTPVEAGEPQPANSVSGEVTLPAKTDYTGVVDFNGLNPGRTYHVTACLPKSSNESIALGTLRTPEKRPPNQEFAFSFVLASCNLSVVSINNLLAWLVTAAGAAVALRSLERPTSTWKFPGKLWAWTRVLWRAFIKLLLMIVAWVIKLATGGKQPDQPFIRSPFLKLSAVFDSTLVELVRERERKYAFPHVGDVVRGSASGACGVVACTLTRIRTGEDRERDAEGTATRWRLVVTQTEGTFTSGEDLVSDGEDETLIGQLATDDAATAAQPWHDKPDFFIHAGDQIYFDFPDTDRAPDRAEYQLAYREAWFDDDAERHLLANYPHYMTLDDHEIVDQFPTDLPRANGGHTADDYLRAATAAYRDYTRAARPRAPVVHSTGPFDYDFERAGAKFFVLDARTQRTAHEIIDKAQLGKLRDWMKDNREALKFVVTSVPFVAEVRNRGKGNDPRWHGAGGAAGDRSNDKWCADRFKQQRDTLIQHIHKERIERLVFLTGDMHCCYHAVMRIGIDDTKVGIGAKYEAFSVHELAGGPVNQLQLASLSQFDTRHPDRTTLGNGEDVSYQVVLHRFHSGASAVMHLTVRYVERDRVHHAGRRLTPEVEWRVIRTLTDQGAEPWVPDDGGRVGEKTMSGRISFDVARRVDQLPLW